MMLYYKMYFPILYKTFSRQTVLLISLKMNFLSIYFFSSNFLFLLWILFSYMKISKTISPVLLSVMSTKNGVYKIYKNSV